MLETWRKTREDRSAGLVAGAPTASDPRSPDLAAAPVARLAPAGGRPTRQVFLAASLLALMLPLVAVSTACAGPEPASEEAAPAGTEAAAEEPTDEPIDEKEPLVGVVTRAEMEAHEPDWVMAQIEAEPDPEAARALLEVPPGADVTVYLGTWCSDSKRELSRLWRAFDEAGIDPSGSGMGEEPPFDLRYVAVDRDKEAPGGLVEGVGLRFVPTFVVRRDGEEVGRMVEVSPNGIEHDLLSLLTGEATGIVSARDDLGEGQDGTGEDGVGEDGAGEDGAGEDGGR